MEVNVASISNHDRENMNGDAVLQHEADELDRHQQPVFLPFPLQLHDPSRMKLSKQETEWALNIKDTIEGFPDIDNLSDYMYAQLALVEQDNIEAAVERAYKLQLFQKEYGTLDSVADGMRHLRNLVEMFPKYLLSFAFDGDNTIFVYNYKGFDRRALNTPEKLRTWFVGCYYIAMCVTTDFKEIRDGPMAMAECGGYDWKHHIDLKLYKRFWDELVSGYPIRFQRWKLFHSGVFTNLLYSMMRKCIPDVIVSSIEIGCQMDCSLDEVFLAPTVEAANERLLDRMEKALAKRFGHESSFVLPEE